MKETTHTHYHAHFMSPAHTHEHDHVFLAHRHQHYDKPVLRKGSSSGGDSGMFRRGEKQ